MIGTTVGSYHILRRMGGGGMSVIYEAEDIRLGRHVALKFLSFDLARDERSRKRFHREAQAASRLDHPNICTILDIVETADGRLCIVMPSYEGESVRAMIGRGPLDLGIAIDIVIQMLRGLERAHSAGILHRDIKPDNLFLTNDGILKILDFGLARIASSSSLTGNKAFLGTLAYASPEQIQHGKVGPATDLWAAGVTLYEMLTSSRPFAEKYEAAMIYAILQEEPVPIRALRPEVPDCMVELLEMTLQKDPSRRAADANALIDCLTNERADSQSSPERFELAVSEPTFQVTVMGKTIELGDGEYIVGRSSDLAIPVLASSVSRRHARILIRGRQATLEDLESKNGTWVRGTRIESPIPLSDFEEIVFGRVTAIFRSKSHMGVH